MPDISTRLTCSVDFWQKIIHFRAKVVSGFEAIKATSNFFYEKILRKQNPNKQTKKEDVLCT